ncbi:hypothetical protein ANO11243_074210 [Dothideomycetidae sp. 11243]|nr:hypothetical protein ANO11243_074210 [fungal sp. No.11243]
MKISVPTGVRQNGTFEPGLRYGTHSVLLRPKELRATCNENNGSELGASYSRSWSWVGGTARGGQELGLRHNQIDTEHGGRPWPFSHFRTLHLSTSSPTTLPLDEAPFGRPGGPELTRHETERCTLSGAAFPPVRRRRRLSASSLRLVQVSKCVSPRVLHSAYCQWRRIWHARTYSGATDASDACAHCDYSTDQEAVFLPLADFHLNLR